MKNATTNWSIFRRFAVLCLLLISAAILSGCGQDFNILRNVKLNSFEREGSVYADLNIELDMGNVQLPTVTFPIYDPDDWAGVQYGTVSVLGGFNGVNEIRLEANLTTLLEVQGGNASLPDGSPLPIGGLGNAQVVQIPIDHDKHRIYFAADEGVAMIGTALTFKEFDKIGQTIGGANLMIPFAFENVRGAAGFFTSTQSGKSGFAIFVDLGQVITPAQLLDMKYGNSSLKSASSYKDSSYQEGNRSRLYFYQERMSNKRRQKFNNYLYKLHRKETKLHLQ